MNFMSEGNYVQSAIRNLLEQKESIVLEQLNELIKSNVLIVEQSEATLVQHPDRHEVTLAQSVRLTFRGAEALKELREENDRLKAKLAEIRAQVKP